MTGSILQEVYFTAGTTTGGDSIDFTDTSGNDTNLIVVSYSDAYQIFPSVNWTMTKLNTVDADNILDNNNRCRADMGGFTEGVYDPEMVRLR